MLNKNMKLLATSDKVIGPIKTFTLLDGNG